MRDDRRCRGRRSLSRSSRGYSPRRHTEYATRDGREPEAYAREAEGSRRMPRDDRDRDFDSRTVRVSDYDDRDRDRFGVRVGSPRLMDKRGRLDRDRDRNEPPVGQLRRLYDEDQRHMDAFGTEFGDFNAGGLRRSSRDHVEDYGRTSFDGAGDADRIRDGAGRDYYPQMPVAQYLDGARQVSVDYEREGRKRSGSYTLDNGSRGGVTRNNLETDEFGRDVSSAEVGYFHLQHELLKKRDDAFRDKQKNHVEINEFDHFQDGPYQDNVGRETSRYMREENLLSSRDYVKNDSDFFYSLSRPEEYVSPSSILRENFPGSLAAPGIHIRSDVISRGSGLISEPTFNGYREKQLHMPSPRRPGDRREDISSSGPYLLPEVKHEDHFYAGYGRSETDHIMTRPREEEEYRHRHSSTMGDGGPWDPYLSRARSTPEKFHEYRSLHGRKRDHNMLGSGSSHLEYGNEVTHEYLSMKHGDYPAEVIGGPLSPMSRGYEPSFDRFYDSPRKRLSPQEGSLGEPFERRPEYNNFRDDAFIPRDSIKTAEDGNNARKLYSEVNGGDDIDRVSLRKKHRSGNLNNERRMPSQRNNHLPWHAKFIKSRSSNPLRSDSRNMNRPLGQVHRKLNLSQGLVKRSKVSAKKRLGPVVG